MHKINGACSTHGNMRNAKKILVEILEGTRPQGRSRYRKKDNIKIYITICGRGLDSSGLGLSSVEDSCEHGNEPLCYIKGGEFLER